MNDTSRIFCRVVPHKTIQLPCIIYEVDCESAFSKLPNHLLVPLDEDVIHSGWAFWKIKWTCKDLARISVILCTVDHYLPASRTEMFVKIVMLWTEQKSHHTQYLGNDHSKKNIHIFSRTAPGDSPIQRPCIQHVLHIHSIFVWLYHDSHS